MKVNVENGEIESILFSSGRRIEPVMGVIGIGYDLELYSGSDETLYAATPDDEYRDKRRFISAEDCVELADHMIATWQRFRDKHAAVAEARATSRLQG